MVRYTTPTFALTLPDTVDLTEAENVYVTFANPVGGVIFTRTDDALEITAHEVDVYLSQEETAQFTYGSVDIQLNWTYHEAGEVKRACSEIARVPVTQNLLAEVVE